jgi:hypothetical protein
VTLRVGPGIEHTFGSDKAVPERRRYNEDEQALPRRRRRTPLAPLWRLSSPSFAALALLMTLLPFLEVSCESPAGGRARMVVATQSGVQSLYGAGTLSPEMQGLKEQKGAAQRDRRSKGQDEPLGPCVGMIVVLGALVAGLAAALVLPLGSLRVFVGASLFAAASVALIIQVSAGFPLENRLAEFKAKTIREEQAKGRSGGAEGAMLASSMVQVHCTPWFWLWLALLHLPLAALVVEGIVAASSSRPGGFYGRKSFHA